MLSQIPKVKNWLDNVALSIPGVLGRAYALFYHDKDFGYIL
jgi:hypothetical protein